MYSNVTPPTLPSYDSVANPYYLIQFEYAIGAENWETVRFWYGAAPLTWNGEAVTNSADCYCQTYGTGSPEWTYWGVMAAAGEMALTPGPTTADTYIRIYTNHDILDGTGAVWLAKGTVTPTEEDKEAEIQIRIKSKLAGIIAAWCAPVRQFPKPTAEPVAFLYNGVRLPDIFTVYTPELQKSHPNAVVVEHRNASGITGYSLNLYAEQNYYEANGAAWFGYDEETPQLIRYKIENDKWALLSDSGKLALNVSKDGAGYTVYLTAIWTNFDLYYSDGTVYCAKSEPVPVYE